MRLVPGQFRNEIAMLLYLNNERRKVQVILAFFVDIHWQGLSIRELNLHLRKKWDQCCKIYLEWTLHDHVSYTTNHVPYRILFIMYNIIYHVLCSISYTMYHAPYHNHVSFQIPSNIFVVFTIGSTDTDRTYRKCMSVNFFFNSYYAKKWSIAGAMLKIIHTLVITLISNNYLFNDPHTILI